MICWLLAENVSLTKPSILCSVLDLKCSPVEPVFVSAAASRRYISFMLHALDKKSITLFSNTTALLYLFSAYTPFQAWINYFWENRIRKLDRVAYENMEATGTSFAFILFSWNYMWFV